LKDLVCLSKALLFDVIVSLLNYKLPLILTVFKLFLEDIDSQQSKDDFFGLILVLDLFLNGHLGYFELFELCVEAIYEILIGPEPLGARLTHDQLIEGSLWQDSFCRRWKCRDLNTLRGGHDNVLLLACGRVNDSHHHFSRAVLTGFGSGHVLNSDFLSVYHDSGTLFYL
jgi:hypothetical protein